MFRALCAGLLLWVLPAGAVELARLQDLRLWAGPEQTRIVFDLSDPVEHTVFTLDNPNRVVIDISHTRRIDSLKDPRQGKGLVKAVRTGIQPGATTRVVLDLSARVKPESFTLPPNGDYGHRLVVDLIPESDAVASELAEMIPPAPTAKGSTKNSTPAQDLIVIAIDAGHGGEDSGARGPSGVREKDVALSIARRLAKLVNAEPGMKAVLIRDGDYYIGLRERTVRARKAQADLFVSVHADAFADRSARGSSVYVLSPRGASSAHARSLAERENASDLVGGVRLTGRDDRDAFLLSVLQDTSLEASFDVAGRLLGEMGQVNRLHKDDVQQAGFMVLRSPDIPSVLVETAFISNRGEEAKLNDADHQDTMARALMRGVRGYFSNYRPSTVATADPGRG
ncbi:MAG: N-acetylmuramoyl-L-alanine amidase [Nevskiales bacterium]